MKKRTGLAHLKNKKNTVQMSRFKIAGQVLEGWSPVDT